MFVDPGELNKRIQIIRVREFGQNDNGFPQETKELICSRWAKVSYITGTERIKNHAEQADSNVRFLIRHSAKEISTDNIILYGGKCFDILYINPYGDSQEYEEIWCKKSERVI